MAGLGDLATVATLLKRAYSLMEGCRSAPEEIYLAREHIHAMTLCLESVKSDIYENPRSFMHQTTDTALTRRHGLKVCINTCDLALRRAEALLKKFLGFRAQHISLWERFKWSSSGKKEMADCKVDLVMATVTLDMFLGKERLNVLYKVESMLEQFIKHMGAFEMHDRPSASTSRPRRGSNIGRTLIVSLVLARLKRILASYRRRKMGYSRGPRPQVGGRRPKPLSRTPSGFRHNPQRNTLMQDYAFDMMADTPPPPYTPYDVSPRPPSPDFYYFSGSAHPPRPSDIRRSDSTQRILGRLNAKGAAPKPPQEHYECWHIKSGSLAFGPKIAPIYSPHRRGQMQLRKMVEVFREAGQYDSRGVTEGDKKVRMLLKEKNKKKGPGGKWYFAAGRLVARDPGRTGMVTVDKTVVVLVRRA